MVYDYAKKSHSYRITKRKRDRIKKEFLIKRIKVFGFLLLFILIISGCIFLFFFSPFFLIYKFNIKGESKGRHSQLEMVVYKELQGKRFFVIPYRNYFVFNDKEFESRLKENILSFNPPILDISVKKAFPNKLDVYFLERVARVRVRVVSKIEDAQALENGGKSQENFIDDKSNDMEDNIKNDSKDRVGIIDTKLSKETYIIDDNGLVFDIKDGNYTDNNPLLFFWVKGEYEASLGDKVLDPSIVSSVVNIYNFLKDYDLVEKFELYKDLESEITVYTKSYKIYFNINNSLQSQLDHLILLLDKVRGQEGKIEYIDLRVRNRAYVCCGIDAGQI